MIRRTHDLGWPMLDSSLSRCYDSLVFKERKLQVWVLTANIGKNQTPRTLMKAEKHEKYYRDLDISNSSSPSPQLIKIANTIIIWQFLSNACSCIKISSFPLKTSNSPSSPRSLFSFLAFHHKVSQGLEFHFLDTHTHDTHFQLPSYL